MNQQGMDELKELDTSSYLALEKEVENIMEIL